MRAALPAWAAARVAVALSVALAHLVFDHVQPSSPKVAEHLGEGVLGWDGQWYERIAAVGYDDVRRVGLRFFPLFPMLARGLGWVLGGHPGLAALLLANGFALAFGAALHRIALAETGDEGLARRATWFAAFAPAAFVLVWAYAEALAAMLAVLVFLALRRKRWWAAAGAGLLGGLARPVGAVLAVPAAIEAARGLRTASATERVARLAAVVAPVAGLASYLAWVGVNFGNPLAPLTLQQRPVARGELANPVETLWRAVAQLVSGDATGNALRVPAALVAIALVVVAFRRWPASYGAYAAVTLLIALGTTRQGSFERYVFGAFPLVLALASVTERQNGERAVLMTSGAAMMGFATLALLGGYVP